MVSMIKMCAKQLGLCEFYITFSTLRSCSFWGYLLLTMLSFLAVDKNKEEFKNGAKLNIDSAYPFLHLQPALNKLKQKKLKYLVFPKIKTLAAVCCILILYLKL